MRPRPAPAPGSWLGWARATGSGLALLAALAGAGCAALTEVVGGVAGGVQQVASGVQQVAQGALTAAPAPAAAALEVEVLAPLALRTVLQRHLDLVRLAALTRGETVSDSELDRLIEVAPAQVRGLAQTEGYFDPEVRVSRQAAREQGGPARILVEVRPGERAVVEAVAIEMRDLPAGADTGADAPRAAQALDLLRSTWALKPGAVFRNEAWSDAKAAALARLRGAGFLAAAWSATAADVDAQRARVRLVLVAEPGPLFRSGRIEVEGLRLHDRATVEHLADFVAGIPLTETLLLDFQDRLQKSGLFERASVAADVDPALAGAAPVRVRVDESTRQQVVLGLGVSANTGPRATFEHLDRRLFSAALSARNRVEFGQARQAWDGDLSTHAGPGLYRWIAGGTVERLESSNDVVLTQRLRAGRAQDAARIERLYFVEADRSTRSTTLAREVGTAYSLNHHWSWRSVDNPVLPMQGLTVALQLGAGTARAGGGASGGFTRLWGRVTGYHPLGDNWYAQARFELGSIFTRQGLDLPDSLRFRAGGDDSVRGYGYRSLGPLASGVVGGGDAVFTSSLELARPISPQWPQFWGAVFVDAGQAANSLADIRPALGSGVGLRWRSPVGPLRLDLAYGEEVRRARLHFSVGIVF
jgi:translocation and assembly module TamA